MIIALCGYKGTGKSTVTDKAIRFMAFGYYKRIGFADTMVEMIRTMGVPDAILRDKSRWNEPVEILDGRSVRHAVDTLGTDWGRDCLGINVWTGICLRRASEFSAKGKTVIIDNVRFISEAVALSEAGATMIAFERAGHKPPPEDLEKPSEMNIAHIQKHFCSQRFVNQGSLRLAARDFRALLVKLDTRAAERRKHASERFSLPRCGCSLPGRAD